MLKETAKDMKNRIEPPDRTKLHESFYKLELTNEWISSRDALDELYHILAYKKGLLTKTAKSDFELEPCGRQPQFRHLDSKRKTILLRVFKTLDLICFYPKQNVVKDTSSFDQTIQRLWDELLFDQEKLRELKESATDKPAVSDP